MKLEKHGEGYLINGILALLKEHDIKILQEYISKIQEPNCYVEIGTRIGGSAILAKETTKCKIYSIDPTNSGKNQFLDKSIENTEGINFITGYSVDVEKTFKEPIEVLFIDGDHNKAEEDFYAWNKHVVSGGYILFHDYTSHPEWNIVDVCNNIMSNMATSYLAVRIPGLPDDNSSILVLQKI